MDIALAIPFPAIDPVALRLGPLAIRWYALAYVAGLVLAWLLIRKLAGGARGTMTRSEVDDLLVWATLGVVLGGRLGYVIFYKPLFFLQNPDQILVLWEGGMSFHGGMLGVIGAAIAFPWLRKRRVLRRVRRERKQRKTMTERVASFDAYKGRLNLFSIGDLCACAAPIGLFFGRVANFVNGELWGRPGSVSWAVIFPDPRAGGVPRHPSQLYEAALEGLVLFVVLMLFIRFTDARSRPGTLGGIFLIGYGLARITAEFYREPDAHLGFLFGGATMGQLLSVPMIVFGAWLIWRARQKAAPPAAA